ncbi:antitoxin Xre/MbcA/ParS toxin-binding domain-containing protein [Granulicella cerasi]|uniref:Antitoxin Xre/MbcA/ParS toxin-binding domain-containing protein n=1 Tax=Granulicella cerasi TaxID=741063 RepID=A0ABW1Z9E8_9BACT|nr:antitoxin Xre/MbcA/ParS toxin-binding domain-containing protein [Granulicella cerasi]
MTASAIATVLGGRKILKRKVETDTDLRVITREGLPVGTLPFLAAGLSVERKTLAKVVGISDRTLSRRIANNSRLSSEESDRMMRLARVFAKAEDTLGSSAKASRWLQSPNLALGEEVPLDLLDTDAGAKTVETILLRIDYGVYS